MRRAILLPILTTMLASATTLAALAQSPAGFQVITPRAEAAPQAVPRASDGADGFRILAGDAGRSGNAVPPARVAIALPPPATPPLATQPLALAPVRQAEPVRPAAKPALPTPAPMAAPEKPAEPKADEPPPVPAQQAEQEPEQKPADEPLNGPAAQEASVRDTRDDNIKEVDSKHPLMLAAHQRTQDSLDEFLQIAAKPPEGARRFMLKVALRTGTETENIWVGALERRVRKKLLITVSENFSGRLANAPAIAKDRKMGDRITFSRSDIRDWMYTTPDRRVAGNHTACAIAAAQNSATLDTLTRQYGLDCTWTKSVTVTQR